MDPSPNLFKLFIGGIKRSTPEYLIRYHLIKCIDGFVNFHFVLDRLQNSRGFGFLILNNSSSAKLLLKVGHILFNGDVLEVRSYDIKTSFNNSKSYRKVYFQYNGIRLTRKNVNKVFNKFGETSKIYLTSYLPLKGCYYGSVLFKLASSALTAMENPITINNIQLQLRLKVIELSKFDNSDKSKISSLSSNNEFSFAFERPSSFKSNGDDISQSDKNQSLVEFYKESIGEKIVDYYKNIWSENPADLRKSIVKATRLSSN